jgi:hypothetical protein
LLWTLQLFASAQGATQLTCVLLNRLFVIGEKAVARIGMTLGFFIIATASASASELPARKAGLWEIAIAGSQSTNVRQCSDASSDQAMQVALGLAGDCSKRDVEKSGSTITVDSVCMVAGKTMTSHLVITGTLDSQYTMTVTSEAPGKNGPSMTLNAKWLGPCEADQKPGDVIMPNGTKINLLQKPNGIRRPGN